MHMLCVPWDRPRPKTITSRLHQHYCLGASLPTLHRAPIIGNKNETAISQFPYRAAAANRVRRLSLLPPSHWSPHRYGECGLPVISIGMAASASTFKNAALMLLITAIRIHIARFFVSIFSVLRNSNLFVPSSLITAPPSAFTCTGSALWRSGKLSLTS